MKIMIVSGYPLVVFDGFDIYIYICIIPNLGVYSSSIKSFPKIDKVCLHPHMHPVNQWTYVRPRCSGVRPKALLGRVLCGGKIFPPGHVKTEPVKRWMATFRDGEANLSTGVYYFLYIDISNIKISSFLYS